MDSRSTARAALRMALTPNREAEAELKKALEAEQIKSTAVDYGGEFLSSLQKVVERAVVASKREGLVDQSHQCEGAVAGATREALAQIMPKPWGLMWAARWGSPAAGPISPWPSFSASAFCTLMMLPSAWGTG